MEAMDCFPACLLRAGKQQAGAMPINACAAVLTCAGLASQ